MGETSPAHDAHRFVCNTGVVVDDAAGFSCYMNVVTNAAGFRFNTNVVVEIVHALASGQDWVPAGQPAWPWPFGQCKFQ